MTKTYDLIVFSHLRWNSVFQRPQQLISRIAATNRVFFIEEPIYDSEAAPSLEITSPTRNLFVCQPHTPIAEPGFGNQQIEILGDVLEHFVREHRIGSHVAWLYTPMASPLLAHLSPDVVVYDCMDALDSFLNAPAALKQREQDLLNRADLLFTGGPSLYRRLEARHHAVHCLPSSVDANHFGKATQVDEPADQSSLPHPRLGFFGVIDERCGLNLLEVVATRRPEWQIIMIGPIAKIDDAKLPRRPNLHYLGKRDYELLPHYVAGWDVCLMPFAINEATRFISPTKVLEYMAAERPIVSTRITDVADPYGHIVSIADTEDEFIAACEAALHESEEAKQHRTTAMRRVVSGTSWDSTAAHMRELVEQTRRKKLEPEHEEPAELIDRCCHEHTASSRDTIGGFGRKKSSTASPPVVIIGAGPSGLSAAYHLGRDAMLLEQNNQIGGWCRSMQLNGFTFDYAGHIMFSKEPYVHQMYKKLLGDNVHWQDREAWIYSKDVYTRYPFQGALYGLPADVITDCIMGAIEARYGTVEAQSSNNVANAHKSNGASHLSNGHSARNGDAHRNPSKVTDCCADGILESTAKLASPPAGECNARKPRNFEEFIYKVWGAGIAKHFAIPYNKKLWAVPLAEMETSWLGGRVPMPDLREMIEGALRPVPKPMGPNARFGYPLRGGFQALMDGFLPHVRDRLRLGARISAILAREHCVQLSDGTAIPYEYLISTMPLPALVRSLGFQAPREVCVAAGKLRHVSVRCVHLGIGRENVTDKHWIYYPEDSVFHRIFVQGNASPHCNPPGGFGLTCEITYSEHKPLPCDGDALIERCIADCRKVGIINDDDPTWAATQCDLPYAYVVYDHDRPQYVQTIRSWLAKHDILLAGRYSEWEYYNSDHAFIAGQKAAEQVQELRAASAGGTRTQMTPTVASDSSSLSNATQNV